MAITHDGGTAHVDYMLMPLTAEESNAGGEYLGMRYAIEHKDRWIDVNHLIFELQTYDRGYTLIQVNGRTYNIHQDVLDGTSNVRVFIGKYVGTAKEDAIGGIQSMDTNPRNIYTWKELIELGVVVEGANVSIDYTKLIDETGRCLIGNTETGGVRLVIPEKTTTGDTILDVSTSNSEEEWVKADYPTRYICEVVLPEGLTSVGANGAAFPMLGRNVIQHKVSIKIPSTVTTIGAKAFYGSKLEKLSGSKPYEFTMDDKLAQIDESAFENCTELSVVHFGKSLTTVGARAFANCKKAQIHFKNTIVDVAADACFMVGDVEYTPRVTKDEAAPEVVSRAPFQAKLWNGRYEHTPGFYQKPIVYPAPDVPTVLPGETDPERTPLDLSGVVDQINELNAMADNISAPKS